MLIISCPHDIRAFLQCAETNQEKIVEAGGLTSLLMLLRSSEDETIHRVAAGAIANLAMNGNAFYICYLRFLEYL